MKCWNCLNSEYRIANYERKPRQSALTSRTVLIRYSLFAILNFAAFVTSARADDSRAARMTPVTRVFQQASPAVVNISSTTIVTYRQSLGFGGAFDDIFQLPFDVGPQRFKSNSVGSGFVIHRDGYVVTNAHVVNRTVERKISFADGTELNADIVALDAEHDLAVLKVAASKPLPFLHLGHSNDLMPGETVIAIGNPLGYKHTVTTGIISAIDRELQFDRNRSYKGLIQTDASINPGNSGGPLLNVVGDLIGINTAIRGDAQNIGFAIPVDRLHELLPTMLDIERLRRVSLGAKFGPTVEDNQVLGARIESVASESPAARAGLLAGDIVTAVSGNPTRSFIDVFSALESAPIGKPVDVSVTRGGSNRKNVSLTLVEVPRPDGGELLWKRFGIRARELTAADLRSLGLRRPVALIVTDVRRGTQAEREGLEGGDLITKIGGIPTGSLDQVGAILEEIRPGQNVGIGVMRIGSEAMIQAELSLKAM